MRVRVFLLLACVGSALGQQSPQCLPQNPSVTTPTTIATNAAVTQYANNQRCTWTVVAPAGQCIALNFTRFATEAGYDFLTVQDAVQPYSLAGSNPFPRFVGAGNRLNITFTSDRINTAAGVAADVTFPALSSPLCAPTLICSPLPSAQPITSATSITTNVYSSYLPNQRR
jgi:hypothetical protein